MQNTPLPDSFTLRVPLTQALLLILMDIKYDSSKSLDLANAVDPIVKSSFGEAYSFSKLRESHKITKATIVNDDTSTSVILLFEKLTQ